MLTVCVQARVGQYQPLDRLPADDVRFDNFVDIGEGDSAIPHSVWIDDEIRAVFALIQTTRLVGADSSLQPARGQLVLECLLQLNMTFGIAARTR